MSKLDQKQLIIRLAIILFFTEIALVFIFNNLPYTISAGTKAVLHSIILLAIAIPVIKLFAISPSINSGNEPVPQTSETAFRDPLTNLPTKRIMVNHLEKIIAGCERHGIYGGVLFIDIDNFREINSRYGEHTGDYVLGEISGRLKSITRSEDITSRIGGEEFAVLIGMLGNDYQEAVKKMVTVAEKLERTIRVAVKHNNRDFNLSASIGIRMITPERTSAKKVIFEAERAMYFAKKRGNGFIEFFRDSNSNYTTALQERFPNF